MSRTVLTIAAFVTVIFGALTAHAHPVVENSLDVVIGKGRIVITARISQEQILVVQGDGGTRIPQGKLGEFAKRHAQYVPKHLRITVDGKQLAATSIELVELPGGQSTSSLVPYRIEYSLDHAPAGVQVEQSFLRELPLWSASCVLRIRQEDQSDWESSLLTAQQTADFGCEWVPHPGGSAVAAARSDVALGATVRAYVTHGIMHILTGYDHMLFIAALVLATTRLWDLVKVVTAFTVAHTITLALAVFDVVHVSEHVVEPMIAISIIFVAVQNIFWPEHSRGWTRLVVAFSFGLFHGLGFAGGLKDAMANMPGITLWAALISFSLGVEIAHQMVILPSFGLLSAARNIGADDRPRLWLAAKARQFGSAGISLAGLYFLVQAVTM